MNSTSSLWFSAYGQPLQNHTRIFAFPHSGAGASVYYKWAQDLKHEPHDFIGLQLPGRENRLREVPQSDLVALMHDLVHAIRPMLNKPFVFFGHSLGGLVAFELCRALRRNKLPLPKHLFVAAFRAPELPNPNRELHRLPLTEMIDGLREYADTPEEVLTNPEMMELFMPLLRADFSLHETYQHWEEAPLPCPITTLSANNDKIVPPELMPGWQKQTCGGFEQLHFDGDHFFIDTHRQAILEQLKQACT